MPTVWWYRRRVLGMFGPLGGCDHGDCVTPLLCHPVDACIDFWYLLAVVGCCGRGGYYFMPHVDDSGCPIYLHDRQKLQRGRMTPFETGCVRASVRLLVAIELKHAIHDVGSTYRTTTATQHARSDWDPLTPGTIVYGTNSL